MHVTVTPFNGLEIISRSERTEVSLGRDPTRTTVLEVRLRARASRALAGRPGPGGSGQRYGARRRRSWWM